MFEERLRAEKKEGSSRDATSYAEQVRGAHQDLLAELNAQMQEPVMEDLFLIGVEFRPCEDSVNTEVHLDAFYQSGALIDENTKRLYQQLAQLKAQL